MKTALIFLFLWSLSNAFYINRFHKWKGDDSDEKGAMRNRYGYFVRRVYIQAPPKYITYARAGGSSEEEDSSDEQEDSVDAGKDGKKAGSEETGAEQTPGKEAEEEEADSEGGEEENGGTSAPEVEESTASQNETETEPPGTASESSTEVQPTQASTTEPAPEANEIPGGHGYEGLDNEEGSNGGGANAAAPYYPEKGYNYDNGYHNQHEDHYGGDKGDYYRRYLEYYRNQLYDHYANNYHNYH
ncbi:integrin-binding sialoprotein-like [Hyperolius riggenbachi]|uniref:integrin-binding sialoprotein-like n=1 Tax=Hyperolius riggenbachi TaxID=752182 RepID=UPI0035A3516B